MSIIDDAIARLQALALASTYIKGAPNYPPEDAGVLPMAVAYISGGNANEINATDLKFIMNVTVDIHISNVILKESYTRVNAIIPDYIKRLGGDPTLNGTVSTIVFPIDFVVGPDEWGSIPDTMIRFIVPIKFNLLSPTVTP